MSSNMGGRAPGNVLIKMHYGSDLFLFKFLFFMGPKELYNKIGSILNKEPSTIVITYLFFDNDEVWLHPRDDSFECCRPSTITPNGLRQFKFNVYDKDEVMPPR